MENSNPNDRPPTLPGRRTKTKDMNNKRPLHHIPGREREKKERKCGQGSGVNKPIAQDTSKPRVASFEGGTTGQRTSKPSSQRGNTYGMLKKGPLIYVAKGINEQEKIKPQQDSRVNLLESSEDQQHRQVESQGPNHGPIEYTSMGLTTEGQQHYQENGLGNLRLPNVFSQRGGLQALLAYLEWYDPSDNAVGYTSMGSTTEGPQAEFYQIYPNPDEGDNCGYDNPLGVPVDRIYKGQENYQGDVNALCSDSLSCFLSSTEKIELGKQVSEKNYANPNPFWQLWGSFTQNGQLKMDHLRQIYEKIDKQDFLKFCVHQIQSQNARYQTRELDSVCQIQSQLPLYQTGGLDKLLTTLFSGMAFVANRGQAHVNSYANSQVKTRALIKGATPTTPLSITGQSTNASNAAPASSLRYVSGLSMQEQKAQAPVPRAKVTPTVPSPSKLPWWRKAVQACQVALFWMGIAAVATGLALWVHTVLSPLPIMKAQNIWLLMSCTVGVGLGWFSAVVMMMRQKQDQNPEHQGAHAQRHEKGAAVQSVSKVPRYAKYHGIITAIDKIQKTVRIQAQNGIQQAKNTLQLLPATFSYQPLSSADLDLFGKELEKRSDWTENPAVIVTVDEESARFTMELQA